MRKKISIALLSILIVPLIALFGCGEVLSYPVYVFSSSTIYGSVSGNGTYNEVENITLTATAKQGSSFVAWIHQNSTLVQNDQNYKIENQTNSNQKVVKSTLTFNVSEQTQWKYTAVFDDNKMMYTKFDSWRITTDPNAEGEEYDNPNLAPLMTVSMELLQGQTSSTLSSIYQVEDKDVRENVIITPENITEILKLQNETKQSIRASTQINFNGRAMSFNFRADLGFQENSEETQNPNYSYQVKYSNEIYQIIFKFRTSTTSEYYLILNYKNLSL